MPYADWAQVRHVLIAALDELADCEFLIMGEAAPPTAPRRRLFGGQKHSGSTRYVQALRVLDVFSAECVGATSFGGTWEMSEVTIGQLRAMGWLSPDESNAAYGTMTPNFDLYVERTDTPGLADLMIASLALLGTQPRALLLQSSGGESEFGT
jgi:hypothetical protein